MPLQDASHPTDPLLLPWDGRAILLVDLDAFFASVEQLDHPDWRGKPVIVGGDPHRHGVVSTCSYEARAFGVRSAMASSMAASLCPDAIWTEGHFSRYREMSDKVMAILHDETPHVQQVSIDEAFMDVTPSRYNREHPVAIARRIQDRVEELGVSCSIGVGTTKAVAKTASDRDKPRGLTVVYPGGEEAFLGPLPIREMSGVGPVAQRELERHGIKTLHDLAEADALVLKKVFGIRAEEMRNRARGQDTAEVEPESDAKSVSNENTFSELLRTREELESAIAAAASKVGRRMRRKGLRGRTLTLKVRYGDRSLRTAASRLPEASDDDLAWLPTLNALLNEVWSPGMEVRLLGVGMSTLTDEPATQESLFDLFDTSLSEGDAPLLDDEKRRSLLQATDALKERFGEDTVRFGREIRNADNLTGSSSKNPADYK